MVIRGKSRPVKRHKALLQPAPFLLMLLSEAIVLPVLLQCWDPLHCNLRYHFLSLPLLDISYMKPAFLSQDRGVRMYTLIRSKISKTLTHFDSDLIICIFKAVSLQIHQEFWIPPVLTCNVIYFIPYTKCLLSDLCDKQFLSEEHEHPLASGKMFLYNNQWILTLKGKLK